MKSIGLSSDNYNKPTPNGVKLIYRTLGFLSIMWIGTIEPRVNIPLQLAHNIDISLIMGLAAIYQFCRYFGYAQPQDLTVTRTTTLTDKTTISTDAPAPNNPA